MALNSRLRIVIPVVVILLALAAVLARFHDDIASVDSLFSSHKAAPAPAPAGGAEDKPKPESKPEPKPKTPKYKPAPSYTPPPVIDPFPLLANTADDLPPIPSHNVPRKDLHREYGLDAAPPLFIGFTRQWPILLQCVVSYVTAGWPAEHIYVLENTGVQVANAQGKLSLQNPFYLNHTTLERLGVNVVRTPALLSFSQMQNMFLHTAHEKGLPYYFYSHQDVVVFSMEDGADDTHRPGDRKWEFYDDKEREETMKPPAAGQPGYRTIYENCLRDLDTVTKRGEKWAFRWYQYDHLTLVNRAAMDSIGGWDSLIPYYATDCDMNARLMMDGWTTKHRRVGIINDISVHMEDLAALYRVPGVEPSWRDPNPPPPEQRAKEEKEAKEAEEKKQAEERKKQGDTPPPPAETPDAPPKEPGPMDRYHAVVKTALEMTNYKYRGGNHNRNSWQKSQRGGEGEPYYYNPEGFAEAFDVLVGAGRQIFEKKWGRGKCDIGEGFGLKVADQWHVLHSDD
ncbi:glycosyl transferase family 8 protein [Colletotrichum plurivorum]|uniref:Glycosyl transferase family 8 protein n=1 Tax=Colletotrichum plurivorum TaxID=2175906 RepID=A0A8H6KCM4_9PEZI|nr:glycosyl transferase family 8 protein [Colletotrichum plurivorum]